MASDGKLIFDTKIDDSGFKQGLGKLKGIAGKGASLITKSIAGVTTALAATGAAATKVGSEFESGMSQVAATMGMTQKEIQGGSKEFKKLESAAREMGATTQFSATEASEALNYIALAGYDADDAIKLLPKTLNLAAAGGLELGYATDIVTDAMSALGLSIDDADSFIDQMAKTSQKSNTSVGQLGEAILTVGGTAKDLAGGTVELNTALGILANNGIKGAEGGTKLRNVIMSLTAPTTKAAKAMDSLGISAFDAEGNMRPLNEVFQDLNIKMNDMTTQEKKEWLNTVFNKQDLAAVSALMAGTATNLDDVALALEMAGGPGEEFRGHIQGLAEDFDQFADKQDFVSHVMEAFGLTAEQAGILYDGLKSSLEDLSAWDALEQEIRNSAGAAEEMSKVMIDNLKGDFTIMQSALQELAISFYQTFQGELRDSVQLATGYIDDLSLAMKGINSDELKTSLDSAGLSVEDFNINLVEAVLKMDQFDSKSEYVSMAMERWGLSSEQAGLLFDSLSESLENTGEKSQIVGEVLGQTISDLVTRAAEALPQFLELGINIIQNILDGISQNIPQISDAALEIGTTLLEGVGEIAVQFLDIGLSIIENLISGIGENAPQIMETMIEIITNLINTIIEHLPQLAEAGGQLIVGIAQGLAENLPTIIEQAPQIISSLISGIVEALPQLIEVGFKIIGELIKGIIQAIPDLLVSSVKIVVAIVTGIASAAGKIITKGAEIIGNFIEGITGKSGDSEAAGTEISQSVNTGLSSGKDQASQSGAELISNYARGIQTSKSEVDTSTKEISDSTKKGLETGKKDISKIGSDTGKEYADKTKEKKSDSESAGKELGDSAVKGANEASKEMSKSGQTAGDQFVKGIKSKSSEAKSVGSEISKSLASGIDSSKSQVDNSIKKIITSALNAIKNKKNEFQNRGKDLIKELVRGFDSTKSQVDNSIKKILQSCINTGNSYKSQFVNVGKNLAQGIAQGISSNSGAIQAAATAAVRNAVNAAKRAGQIRSPSRLMKKEVGFYLSAGMAEGIKSGQPLIEDANKNLIHVAEAQLKKLIERGATKDVLKNYLGKNIEDAINYGNLLLNQSNLDFNNYNSNFKLIDKIKDEINMSKNLIEDSFNDLQFKLKIDSFLNLPKNKKSEDNSRPIEISIYGADYSNKNQAYDYGRKLFDQFTRERRRYGG